MGEIDRRLALVLCGLRPWSEGGWSNYYGHFWTGLPVRILPAEDSGVDVAWSNAAGTDPAP
jgi:hypothetical protein